MRSSLLSPREYVLFTGENSSPKSFETGTITSGTAISLSATDNAHVIFANVSDISSGTLLLQGGSQYSRLKAFAISGGVVGEIGSVVMGTSRTITFSGVDYIFASAGVPSNGSSGVFTFTF